MECADEDKGGLGDDSVILSLHSRMGSAFLWERKLGESQVRARVLMGTCQGERPLSQAAEMPGGHRNVQVLSWEEQDRQHWVAKFVDPDGTV